MTKRLAVALLLAAAFALPAQAGTLVEKTNPYDMLRTAITLPAEDQQKEALLLETIELKPDYGDAAFRLAIHYSETGNYNSSATAIQRARKLEPMNKGFARHQGQLYFLNGRMSEGIEAFSNELKAHPERTFLHKEISHLLFQQEQYGQGLTVANAWRKAEPNNSEAAFWQGYQARFLGDFDQAIARFQESIELGHRNDRPYQELLVSYEKSDRLDEAVAYFTSLTDADNENAIAYHVLSAAHGMMGNHEAAKVAAEAYADLRGEDNLAVAMHVVARALERGGDFEDSLTALFEARRADLHSEFTYDRIKDLIFRVGRLQDGIDYFTRLASEHQEHYIYRIIGEIAMRDGQWELAQGWLTRYLETKPYKALAYSQTGLAFARLNQTEAALEAFKNAAWFNLGISDNFYRVKEIYRQTNRLEQGIGYFNEVIGLFPEKAHLHLYIADLYEAQGHNDKAVESLKTAMELAPVSYAKLNERIGRLENALRTDILDPTEFTSPENNLID